MLALRASIEAQKDDRDLAAAGKVRGFRETKISQTTCSRYAYVMRCQTKTLAFWHWTPYNYPMLPGSYASSPSIREGAWKSKNELQPTSTSILDPPPPTGRSTNPLKRRKTVR